MITNRRIRQARDLNWEPGVRPVVWWNGTFRRVEEYGSEGAYMSMLLADFGIVTVPLSQWLMLGSDE